MRESIQVKDFRAPINIARSRNVRTSKLNRHVRVYRGTVESPSVSLLKYVLNPSVIVLTLLVCVLAYGQPLTPSYLALAALTFLVAAQIVSDPVLDDSAYRSLMAMLRHRIFAEWLLVSAVLLLLAFAFKVTDVFSRRVILTWFALTPFTVLAAQAGLRRFTEFSALRGSIAQSHVIVGANDAGLRLAQRLQANPHLGTFKGFFDDRQSGRVAELPDEQLLGSMTDIAGYVRLNAVSNIYICLPIRAEQRVLRLMDEMKDTTASVYFVPDIFVFDLMQAQLTEIDGIPVVAVCETPFCGMNGVLKRASDILLSSVLIMLLWPVMLAIAAGVRFTSPGSIVFRQRRYGLYGESIVVYKFRSMSVCEDEGSIAQVQRDDPRVTPFGRFLRRTSLDELPQLFNVLSGTMSLVGPRPHAVAHNEEYRKLIEGYMLRHKVRPGITGWAQVNGLRGETETVDKMKRRVEYDLDYLRNWSLGLDFDILLRTAHLVLRDSKAY